MLKRAIERLASAEGIIDSVLSSEQDALDNIPENLQSSPRYEKIEACVDSLEDALEKIDEVKDVLEEVMV